MTSIADFRPGVIGRDDDLAAGDRFLDVLDDRSATLVLEGEPGIGKTTVWSEIRERAFARGHTVLTSQPVQSETELPFAGLLDLLGEHLDLLCELPDPQRRALEIALARVDPEASETVGSLAASAGFNSLIIRMSRATPVVIAIDDLQWLDVPTFRVVSFAVRRLGSLRAPGSVTRLRPRPVCPRPRSPSDRHRGRGELSPPEAAVDGEPRSADRRAARIHASAVRAQPHRCPLGRQRDRRSRDSSGFDEERARAGRLGWRDPGDRGGARLATRRAAARHDPGRPAPMCRAVPPTAQLVDASKLEPAIAAGLVALDADDRIRFAHPLFARAVYSRATAARRADVHRWFSERVPDPDEQTLHADLASSDRDAGLALRLHQAAERTRRKGAPEFAAGLEERAAARTPSDDFELELARRLRGAEHHERAGNIFRATALAEDVLSATRDPAVRARAHGLVAQIAFGESFPTAIDLSRMRSGSPAPNPAAWRS